MSTSFWNSPWVRHRGRWLAAVTAVVAAVVLASGPAQAAGVSIKLATLIPDGSVWDKALKEMGAQWKNDTAGRVSLRVYPGGVAGDESDVLRKIRIGQLHAGTFTVVGLADIDPAFNILAVPLFFESYDELYHVVREIRPDLEKRLEAKGFVLVQWGYGGWVHMFSRNPVRTTVDLEGTKIFVWAGDDRGVRWWKGLGYRPVALAATDIMTGLQTGMIDVIRTTPLAALSLQWFRQTPNMNELGLGPLTGATIVSKKTWDKIEPQDRSLLLATARRLEERLRLEIPGQDALAVEQMKERGLQVTEARGRTEWQNLADRFVGLMRTEKVVPEDVFDRTIAIRDTFRRTRAEPAGDAREPAAGDDAN